MPKRRGDSIASLSRPLLTRQTCLRAGRELMNCHISAQCWFYYFLHLKEATRWRDVNVGQQRGSFNFSVHVILPTISNHHLLWLMNCEWNAPNEVYMEKLTIIESDWSHYTRFSIHKKKLNSTPLGWIKINFFCLLWWERASAEQ